MSAYREQWKQYKTPRRNVLTPEELRKQRQAQRHAALMRGVGEVLPALTAGVGSLTAAIPGVGPAIAPIASAAGKAAGTVGQAGLSAAADETMRPHLRRELEDEERERLIRELLR